MTAKRFLSAAQACGLAVALVVNAALLALLAVGPAVKLHLQPEVPAPVVFLEMAKPPPRKVIEPPRKAETRPTQPQARPSPVAPRLTPAPPPSVAPLPLPAVPAPVAPSAPAPAGPTTSGAASDKGAAAVRHLLGCAAFASGRRRDGEGCETQRSVDAGHVDSITPERRLSLGPTSQERRDELVQTHRELQSELPPIPMGGTATSFGCNLKAGKWKCSTY